MELRRDVFLCHAGSEKSKVVSVIREALRQNATSSFLDIRDLVSGQTSEQTIKPALQNARAVVIVVSLEFLKRDYPMKELHWLVHSGNISKAVPVFYELTRGECKKDALSPRVRTALWKNPLKEKSNGYDDMAANLDILARSGNIDSSLRST